MRAADCTVALVPQAQRGRIEWGYWQTCGVLFLAANRYDRWGKPGVLKVPTCTIETAFACAWHALRYKGVGISGATPTLRFGRATRKYHANLK
jgi:hypothetical protein